MANSNYSMKSERYWTTFDGERIYLTVGFSQTQAGIAVKLFDKLDNQLSMDKVPNGTVLKETLLEHWTANHQVQTLKTLSKVTQLVWNVADEIKQTTHLRRPVRR